LQGVYCAKRVRIITSTGRDSKFIIIEGVKSHNVTEDQYGGSVAVLQYSPSREYTRAMAHTGRFATLGYTS